MATTEKFTQQLAPSAPTSSTISSSSALSSPTASSTPVVAAAPPSTPAVAAAPMPVVSLGEFNISSVAFNGYKAESVITGGASGKDSGVVASGTHVALKKGDGKSFKCIVLSSKTWGSPNVGVYIDIPLSGVPIERLLVATLIEYNFQKMINKLYHTDLHGIFNPRMRSDGAEYFNVYYTIAEDGFPSEVKVNFTVVPRKVGSLTAKLLAKACISPAASDLASPELIAFERNREALAWAVKKAIGVLNSAPVICVIGGRKKSISRTALEKFENTFKKNFNPPAISGGSPLKTPHSLLDTVSVLLYDVGKLKHASSKAVVAQVLSIHGHVYYDGKHIGLFCLPDYTKYAFRSIKKVLGNEGRLLAALGWFAKTSKKDPIGGDSMQTLISISAVGNGLPITIVDEILKETVTPAVIAKEVAALNYVPKIFSTEKHAADAE